MTKLQEEMKKRGVSTYQILKYLKSKNKIANVFSSHTALNRKIAGQSAITPEQLKSVCEIISELSKQPLSADNLPSELAVYTIRLK